jgi:uncharacterized membrane protein YkoI
MLTLAKKISVLALLVALAGASPATADDDERERDEDHHQREAVRQAVERGEVKSLLEVLHAVKPELPGEVIGVEIEREGAAWVYEFRVADEKGRLLEVYVDAATAKILKTEEK